MSEKIKGWPETPVTSKAKRGIVLRCSTPTCDGEWTNNAVLPPDQVTKWAERSGWEIAKNFRSATCPGCMAKRDVPKVRGGGTPPMRQVMAALEDHYDDDAKCYDAGWDDAKIADSLDVSVAFVAKMRADYFGPAEDMRITDLRAEILEVRKSMEAELTEIRGMLDDARGRWTARIDELGTKLAGLLR